MLRGCFDLNNFPGNRDKYGVCNVCGASAGEMHREDCSWKREMTELPETNSLSKSPILSPNEVPVLELKLESSQFKKDALSLRVTTDRLVANLIAQKWVVRSREATALGRLTQNPTLLVGQLVQELHSMEQLCTALIDHVSNVRNFLSTPESDVAFGLTPTTATNEDKSSSKVQE